MRLLDAINGYHIMCTVRGGGATGQAGAIRLGVSRALERLDPALRPALRKAGFLTRDSRVVESKKPGQKKARKKFTWYATTKQENEKQKKKAKKQEERRLGRSSEPNRLYHYTNLTCNTSLATTGSNAELPLFL